MKIGVLSDTHNQVTRTTVAVQMLVDADCDLLLHCGDLANAKIVEVCSRLPLHFVIGNHDDFEALTSAAKEHDAICHGDLMDVTWGDCRILMTHGHLKPVAKQLQNEQTDFLLMGHSHVAMDEQIDSGRLINPGALHRIKVPSVAVIDTADRSVEFLLVPK